MLNKKILNDIKKSLIGIKEFKYIESSKEMYYPIDLEFTLEDEVSYYNPKDRNGVPQRKYKSIGLTYNPTRIASYSLAHWNRYLKSKKESDLEKFKVGLNWFIDNHDKGIWYYNFDWNELKAPWLSGMAQGQVLSVLSRAYKYNNKLIDKEILIQALTPFQKEIKNGGVLSYLNEDVFFEEYPTTYPKHVLNGYLFALIGLIDLLKVLEKSDSNYQKINKIINEGLKSLENNIHRWDNGYWSLYDLGNENEKTQNVCTISYHSLQVTQLKYIGNELESEILIEYSEKWNMYMKSFCNRIKALLSKIIYRYKNPAQR